ncbi:thioredoxin reductase 3-like [Neofelis nebulosa]|uniref:thioredoxin reductase 3-like n=1 Tax=Neofelis nebulosa TaxID=61452 RepID=UPI002729BA05|nr:thioredoxin reductase 3-like [Neofelis nebulosa]
MGGLTSNLSGRSSDSPTAVGQRPSSQARGGAGGVAWRRRGRGVAAPGAWRGGAGGVAWRRRGRGVAAPGAWRGGAGGVAWRRRGRGVAAPGAWRGGAGGVAWRRRGPGAGRRRGRGGASGGQANLWSVRGVGGVHGSPFPGPVLAPPPASRSLSRSGQAGSDTEALAQPPPPPPPRAQTSPGPVKVGTAPNRRLGSVRGVLVSSPPGRRARLSSPGTGRSSSEAREELRRRLLGLIEGNRVMIFSKSYCPHCTRVKELFSSLGVQCNILELDQVDDGANVQEVLSEITNQRTVPNIFVNKVHMGGCDRTFQAHQSGLLQKLLQEDSTYDYDLIVIGGGSGGLACAQV